MGIDGMDIDGMVMCYGKAAMNQPIQSSRCSPYRYNIDPFSRFTLTEQQSCVVLTHTDSLRMYSDDANEMLMEADNIDAGDCVDGWEKYAEQGSPCRKTNLGQMYEHGWLGLKQSDKKAVEWYDKAVEQLEAMGHGDDYPDLAEAKMFAYNLRFSKVLLLRRSSIGKWSHELTHAEFLADASRNRCSCVDFSGYKTYGEPNGLVGHGSSRLQGVSFGITRPGWVEYRQFATYRDLLAYCQNELDMPQIFPGAKSDISNNNVARKGYVVINHTAVAYCKKDIPRWVKAHGEPAEISSFEARASSLEAGIWSYEDQKFITTNEF